MGIELALMQGRRWHTRRETDRGILLNVQFRLGFIAFCDDYPPALIDILNMANKSGGMILSPEEELYLIERTHLHGTVHNAQYKQAILHIKKRFSSKEHFHQVRSAIKQNKLQKLKIVTGFWQEACKTSGVFKK